MKFYAKMPEGPVLVPDAKVFTHYVQGEAFRFAYHKSLGILGHLTVSHYDSGSKITDIPPDMVGASGHDLKLAAKRGLERVIEKAGEARVRSALAGAPDLVRPS